ncbi:universal stress protein [Haloplanus sp.]|uniref:universal stress protein n=1 Tax=Haloplanus sp. TaxID=1961696 RepID=UPI00261339BF|nr:universal stress protein [Haloplanus sp.]
MIARVLVPMDDSEMAGRALRYALEVFPGAKVTVLHVSGGPSPMMGEATEIALSDDPEGVADDHAEDALDRARAVASECDAEIQTEVRVGHPARTILDRAEAFDGVVLGSHSGGLMDRLFVGNVAETVVRGSPVPVTVVQ